MDIITLQFLNRQPKACNSQLRRFEEVFPHGMPVTYENVQYARQMGLDVDWFACTKLSGSAYLDWFSLYCLPGASVESRDRFLVELTLKMRDFK